MIGTPAHAHFRTYVELDVEAGGDDTALVDAADEVHHDLAGALVVDDLELTDVS